MDAFNFGKYADVLADIPVNVRKISFTGGEPSIPMGSLEHAIRMAKAFHPNAHITVNTNGYDLKNLLRLADEEVIDSIALSRHHYYDGKNDEIFGIKNLRTSEIYGIKDKSRIHLSCNLIKGYIDSPEQVKLYLDWAGRLGILDVGFVSLMDVNTYCRDHHVDFASLDLEDENLICNKTWQQDDVCRCRNYLFLPETTDYPVAFYARFAAKHAQCNVGLLVYDITKLRVGFGGKIIR